jgi:hypothetical protein
VHEGLEGVVASGSQFGGIATAMGFRGNIPSGAKAEDQIADTAQTQPKAHSQLSIEPSRFSYACTTRRCKSRE